ncbi:MAG: drug/metabolite transporter (DMT)-like permease [Crocinitomix sp.]|jgi:drug/metabolite transporter (DMT)-like permease
MLDLVLGILFFNVILILFKLFERYGVDNLQAIIVNYIVAGSCGFIFAETNLTIAELFDLPWIGIAVLIGFIFIVVFNLLAKGAQVVGMAISTVANKMSVILPVIAAFFLYGDTVSTFKVLGICLALVGVVLSSIEKGKLSFDKKYLWLILIVFFGQGIADILFNYAAKTYVDENHASLFISVLFLSAFISGTFLLIVALIRKKESILPAKKLGKNVLWGIALGIPNYLTVFYFFRALDNDFMESSQVYPILNMGVIVLSALSGYLLFKEKLSLTNWIGIAISVLAIAAISAG